MVGQYDTDQKIKILGIDLVSAILAAGSVAPGIAIVDQGKDFNVVNNYLIHIRFSVLCFSCH